MAYSTGDRDDSLADTYLASIDIQTSKFSIDPSCNSLSAIFVYLDEYHDLLLSLPLACLQVG
jgi:hypothetical protein